MILLSLVGEQPIPNLLPIWQLHSKKEALPDWARVPLESILFVATRSTRQVAKNLGQVIQSQTDLPELEILPMLIVEPYDTHTIRVSLDQALQGAKDAGMQAAINITGGTKLMSMAALQTASDREVPMMYVNTEKNEIQYFDPKGVERASEPIRVNLSIQHYLEAHGLEVSDNLAFNPAGSFSDLIVPKEGDGLEIKVETLARNSGYFDEVRRNVFIRKHSQGEKPVINELDVVAISNGRLVVCSCKSGRNLVNNVLYELTTLSRREAAGIYCGKVLVSSLNDVPPGVLDRARESQIKLVYGSEVDRVAFHMHLAVR